MKGIAREILKNLSLNLQFFHFLKTIIRTRKVTENEFYRLIFLNKNPWSAFSKQKTKNEIRQKFDIEGHGSFYGSLNPKETNGSDALLLF